MNARDQILDAAERVFARLGYQAGTTKEIARSAGVSEGALYYHFDSKRDMLVAILDRLSADPTLTVDTPDAAALSFRELFVRAKTKGIKDFASRSDIFFSLLSEILADHDLALHVYDRMFRQDLATLERLLEDSIREGWVRVLDVAFVARILFGVELGLDLLYLMGDEVVRKSLAEPARSAETLADVVIEGILCNHSSEDKEG
jgi:AcrR family transcriptional regulator